jgi:hypothetical protein
MMNLNRKTTTLLIAVSIVALNTSLVYATGCFGAPESVYGNCDQLTSCSDCIAIGGSAGFCGWCDSSQACENTQNFGRSSSSSTTCSDGVSFFHRQWCPVVQTDRPFDGESCVLIDWTLSQCDAAPTTCNADYQSSCTVVEEQKGKTVCNGERINLANGAVTAWKAAGGVKVIMDQASKVNCETYETDIVSNKIVCDSANRTLAFSLSTSSPEENVDLPTGNNGTSNSDDSEEKKSSSMSILSLGFVSFIFFSSCILMI